MFQMLLVIIYIAFISLGLPDSLLGKQYYRPTTEGFERNYGERYRQILEWKEAAARRSKEKGVDRGAEPPKE